MKKSVVILLNIGYWVLYLFLFFVFYLLIGASQGGFANGRNANLFGEWLKVVFAFAIVPGFFGFYSAYLWMFSKYLSKRRIGMLFLMLIPMLLGACVLGSIAVLTVTRMGSQWNNALIFIFTMFLPMAFVALVNAAIGLVMRGFITSYSDIILKEELNKKNYEMELALIKAQIDPHFLFNTLNNIDVLIEMDAKRASAYLNKLSDIMRFMLYEAKTEKIPLSKEISYIEKYIELQKIRSSNSEYVSFHFEGVADMWTIQPMLFIPFIENAFKHAENRKEGNAIKISILAGGQLSFECENKFVENTTNELAIGGLGSGLIQKRLNLLYPNKHQLNISKTQDTFTVKLVIED